MTDRPDIFFDAMTDDTAAVALLQWYVATGADVSIGDIPVNRLVPAAPLPSAPEQPLRAAATPANAELVTLKTASAHTAAAAAVAKSARSLADLKAAITAFDGCALSKTAMNTVFADGNPESPLMIIGDAPGGDEDRQGMPFVGASGQLLDRMLKAIGRDRMSLSSGAYLINVLPWRPPGNRKPTEQELAVCIPFLRRHIALVKPKVLLFFGSSAASALLDVNSSIPRLRGRWLEYRDPEEGLSIPVMSTYHPSQLMQQPAFKKDAWHDLIALKIRLDELAERGDK